MPNERDKLIHLIMKANSPLISPTRAKQLADYLLDNSIIVPPCKVGDIVYIIDYDEEIVGEYIVKFFYCSSKGINRIYCQNENSQHNFRPKDIGKNVFFKKEDAEKRLKEGADNG